MKKIVYTILIGDYKLNEPTYYNKDWELICFTDKKRYSNNWKMIYVNGNNNPRKKAREIKIRYDKFLNCDMCLFIDAKFTIKCNLDNFIEKNLKHDMVLMDHFKRNCIYNEAKFCINKNIGNKDIIQNQVLKYRKEEFPKNFGLFATGILIRKNTKEIRNFMKQWYNEIEKYSNRDQISFPYVLWKNPIKLNLMNFKETYRMFR